MPESLDPIHNLGELGSTAIHRQDSLPIMTITPPETPTNMDLKIEVIPASDLLQPSRRKTLRTLCRLINDAFSAHGHPKDNGETVPGALFIRKRLIDDEELPGNMGPESLIAICTDESLSDDGSEHDTQTSGKYGKIVATGSVMLYKGRVVDIQRSLEESLKAQNGTTDKSLPLTDQNLTKATQQLANSTQLELDTSTTWNWEVKLCSSSDDPLYRGRGLMVHCVDALIASLKTQQAALREVGDERGTLPIKLWSTSLEGTGNTEYWIRRGFERVGIVEVAPAGMWTSTSEIRISTLCKVVE